MAYTEDDAIAQSASIGWRKGGEGTRERWSGTEDSDSEDDNEHPHPCARRMGDGLDGDAGMSQLIRRRQAGGGAQQKLLAETRDGTSKVDQNQ